jgi:hypothetical protein
MKGPPFMLFMSFMVYPRQRLFDSAGLSESFLRQARYGRLVVGVARFMRCTTLSAFSGRARRWRRG